MRNKSIQNAKPSTYNYFDISSRLKVSSTYLRRITRAVVDEEELSVSGTSPHPVVPPGYKPRDAARTTPQKKNYVRQFITEPSEP